MNDDKDQKQVQWRLWLVLIILSLWIIVVAGRLFQVQIVEHSAWLALAASIQERKLELPVQRGVIYDRTGIPLAFDVPTICIAVDSFNMTRPTRLVEIMADHLEMNIAELKDLIYRPRYFTWIHRQVDRAIAQSIAEEARQAGARGLIFINSWKRAYPAGSLASNIIGFVGLDRYGLEGIELFFNEQLTGTPKEIHVVRMADGSHYQTEVLIPGTVGQDIYLTIDKRVQFIAEEEISRGVAKFQAVKGFIIIIDPWTGEILAMAQDRRFDLNDFRRSTPQDRKNMAVNFLFEPGSIFKAITGLGALEAKVARSTDRFDGDTGLRIAAHTIHNAEHRSFGMVSFTEIMAKSINTGMIRIIQRLSEDQLYNFLRDLGFGERTGITLPGEEQGLLRHPDDWSALSLAMLSFGQEISVTGIQLAAAMATIPNRGLLITPSIVRSGDDSEAHTPGRRVISRQTAAALSDMLRLTMTDGTGWRADIPQFNVAGKTGTAQKAIPGKGYVPGKYTSLFAGFFPACNPRYLALVVLDEVGTRPVWGGYTAGYIFRNTMERIILVHHIPPVE